MLTSWVELLKQGFTAFNKIADAIGKIADNYEAGRKEKTEERLLELRKLERVANTADERSELAKKIGELEARL